MPDRELAGVLVERKWMSSMMWIIGLGLIAMGAFLPNDPTAPENPLVMKGLMVMLFVFGLLPIILCPRYHVSFREDMVVITVGYFNLIKVKLARNKITHVGLIKWNPMKNFGGSGIKGGFGEFSGYICFNILSGTGIEIKTTEKNYVIEMNDHDRNRLMSLS